MTVSTGIISTIAGTGTSSFSGDGGAATSATFKTPRGVALDSSGIKLLHCKLYFLFLYTQVMCTSLIPLTIVSVR